MMMRPLHLLISVTLLTPLACGGTGDPTALADHRALWNKARIDGYAFTYEEYGFDAMGGRVRLHVRGGKVVAAEHADGPDAGQPLPEDELQYWPAMERLFYILERDTDQMAGCDPGGTLSIRYDDELGYPIAYDGEGGEEGWGFDVSDFVVEED